MQSLNPYIVGNSVGGSPAFVGRDDILQNVHDILKNSQQNAILLHGQRRIGKTSILGELETQLQQKGICYPILFNLLGKAHQPVEQVIQELANKISDVLRKAEPQLGDDPKTYFHQTWLPEILNKNAENPLVLLFDEFDALDDDLAKHTKTEFFRYLHDLVELNQEKLNFVFVIGSNISDLTQIALALFKGIPAKRVSLLKKEDSFKLIELAEANQTLRWSTRAKNTVWQLTQGHPYLTQQTCFCVWEQLYKGNVTKIPKVLPKHIEQVMPTVLERSESAINWLWGGLEAAQKVFISAIAEADYKIVTKEKLNNLLSSIGIKISVPALADAPKSLQYSWDLITENKKGYHFKVELLRRLVAKYKPLHSVKNELNRLEPEANNYYQESLQLYEEKKLDEALDGLGRVLRLNPNHIAAPQLQANILLKQGKLEEASNKLNKLFEDHPDEASHLLVQTLWKIAQSAKREGEQLKFYEEILQFDKNHIDAKKKIHTIWKRRAERALRDEDFEGAINAYQKIGLKDKVSEIKKKCFLDKYSKLIVQVIVFLVVLLLSYIANIFKLDIDIPWWVWGSGLGIIAFYITGKFPFKRKIRDEF
jgi:tetratricopeptide (TPR) repeat protein